MWAPAVRKVDAGRELSPAAQVGSRLEGVSVRPPRIPAAARAPVSAARRDAPPRRGATNVLRPRVPWAFAAAAAGGAGAASRRRMTRPALAWRNIVSSRVGKTQA